MPISRGRLLGILGLSFATTLSANIMNPGLFGYKVLQVAPSGFHNTYLGLLTFVWSTITIVNLPLVGALSDATSSPLGKRIPFFILGAAGMSLAVVAVAFAPSLGILVLAVVFLSLFDDTIIAPWLAYFRESIPAGQRGEAAGFKALLDILAVVLGRQLAGYFLGSMPIGELLSLITLSVIIMAALWVSTGLSPRQQSTFSITRDRKSIRSQDLFTRLSNIYSVDWKKYPAFTWWFANRLLFWMAFIILGTFTLFFAIDALGYGEAQAQRFVATISTLIGLMILLIAVPAGRLADRIDNRAIVFVACLLAAMGTAALLVDQRPMFLWGGALLVGTASGVYMSANLALVTRIVPANEAGRYLGISGVASAIGGALARLLGGLIIDPINIAAGSTRLGHIVLFSIAAGLFALAGVTILGVRPAISSELRVANSVEMPEDIG
ncbi:MAG: MFS transporter [Chloroflexi bacterium]|nr:MFS transporter [Chloroflexota bacterium]